VALAEAARCLTLLERDLPQADAMISEAGALSARLAIEPAAIPDAIGMLRLHDGRLDAATANFQRARDLCRREEDRLGEFRALEHLVMVHLQQRRFADARALTAELVQIANRLREGSEAPFAHAVSAMCEYALTPGAGADLDAPSPRCAPRTPSSASRICCAARPRSTSTAATPPQPGRAPRSPCTCTAVGTPSDVVLARAALARAAATLGECAASTTTSPS